MNRFEKCARKFRETFGLPKDAETRFTRHGVWIEMSPNPLGAIELKWGIKYEGVQAQIIWHRGKPVFAYGEQYPLTVLIYFAELMGMDINHPYLQNCKQAADYEKIRVLWQIKE